jgi:glycerophosphoryl diester phosphodiesterase
MVPLTLLLTLLVLLGSGCAARVAPLDASVMPNTRPLVIAHRGASGVLPEHTIEAYRLAIEQGADFIEPDLVITRDGVLVARHENEISETTDVADRPEFAARRTTKSIDGKDVTGWFVEDFTLAELKTLRARQRMASRDQSHNDRYLVPTFDEVLDLAIRESRARGRVIGVYPETKHPSYFRSIGKPLEEPLLASLRHAGWDRADAPVFIQSFESGNLRELSKQTRVPLVQLIDSKGAPFGEKTTYADMLTPAGLREIASYARGIGPHKSLILPLTKDGTPLTPTTLVADAHAAGLLVHPWTFRSDRPFLPAGYATPRDEYLRFFNLGVDGVFSDFPDDANAARR